jgi:hypothetical protein
MSRFARGQGSIRADWKKVDAQLSHEPVELWFAGRDWWLSTATVH